MTRLRVRHPSRCAQSWGLDCIATVASASQAGRTREVAMKEPVAQRTGDPAESEPLVLPLDEVDASMVGRVGGTLAS